MALTNDDKKLVLLLALQNARRIGEILQLQFKDFNITNKTLFIRPEINKTATSELIPVSDEVIRLVEEQQKKQKPSAVIAQKQYNTYKYWFKPMLVKCSSSTDEIFKGKSIHQTRHFFPLIMGRENGFDKIEADAMLSHSDSETVLETYGVHIQQVDIERYFTHYWKLLKQ